MARLLVYAVSAAISLAIQLSGFAVAFALQTETFYDTLGGVNYLTLVAWSALHGPSWTSDTRKIAVSAIFVCSRSWLLLFLAWRAHERKGDARFDGVKDKLRKFLTFWIVQGMWVMLISMPMLFINSSAVHKPDFSLFDSIMLGGFTLGVVIEVVADIQKAVWVKSGRVGGFCQVGVWHFSRHPNYFGEILQWWCIWALAYSSSEYVGEGYKDLLWWACLTSPVFTMHILLNLPPTGVWNAEGKNLKRYYEQCPDEYARYRESTSVLIPMIGYKYVPLYLKRTIFFDFERYEYKPRQDGGQGSKTD
mmetsp:Transcript_135986/g.379002  ORF Transcript_135986/g.379002 Transcript_135986/m.379002 type:complete len:306 (+) Transcript_135986:56-973(+)|eukprot:CAMPEP_0179020718 /NCGR_PEP_ID=MMETSP0796-20121207/5520_1 /TAXON_ID=73915 /ORGANISM="Pyrodinium bahamense, Strain pbaha01" /LENGTH=305 /DNA_ID=CAMNT_0020716529 /DNA_START=54 /DNA_END=971 /DNA_ORIENTATION=+